MRSLRWGTLLLALLWSSQGQAQELDVTTVDPDLAWEVERTARWGRFGLYSSIASVPVTMGGVLLLVHAIEVQNVEEVAVMEAATGGLLIAGGGVALFAGPAIQAASGVKGARLTGTDATLGYWAWGLWAGSLFLGPSLNSVLVQNGGDSVAAKVGGSSLLTLGGYVGSLVVGARQHRFNQQAAGLLPTSQVPHRRLRVAIVPDARGIRLVGQM